MDNFDFEEELNDSAFFGDIDKFNFEKENDFELDYSDLFEDELDLDF